MSYVTFPLWNMHRNNFDSKYWFFFVKCHIFRKYCMNQWTPIQQKNACQFLQGILTSILRKESDFSCIFSQQRDIGWRTCRECFEINTDFSTNEKKYTLASKIVDNHPKCCFKICACKKLDCLYLWMCNISAWSLHKQQSSKGSFLNEVFVKFL